MQPEPTPTAATPTEAAHAALRDVEQSLSSVRSKLLVADLAVAALVGAARVNAIQVTDELLVDALADWAEADEADCALWMLMSRRPGGYKGTEVTEDERLAWRAASEVTRAKRERVFAVAVALLGRRRELAALDAPPRVGDLCVWRETGARSRISHITDGDRAWGKWGADDERETWLRLNDLDLIERAPAPAQQGAAA